MTPKCDIARRPWDAIVVGAGAVGGLAALLLARAGFSVLVLDAGWNKSVWRAPLQSSLAGAMRLARQPDVLQFLPAGVSRIGRRVFKALGHLRQPVQTKCFAWEMGPEFLSDDSDFPYVTDEQAPFHWFRGLQVGGRMVVPGHGRQYYRMSASDFHSSADGQAWPLNLCDLEPWYAIVENLLGLRGQYDGLASVPDSHLGTECGYSPAEADLVRLLVSRWPDISPIIGRSAPPMPALPLAFETGNVGFRSGASVREIQTDDNGRVRGVAWFDRADGRVMSAASRLVFLGASALESARILMMSRSSGRPMGLGGGSGVLGRFLMDHLLVSAGGVGPSIAASVGPPKAGHCIYIPRMDHRDQQGGHDTGPYGMQIYQWNTALGQSAFNAVSFSSMAPRSENRIVLHHDRKDAFGCPVLHIHCVPNEGEIATTIKQHLAIVEVADTCGVKLTRPGFVAPVPGAAIHECGVARMGWSPESSVVDPFNQCWDAPGLYVTDASSFPSLPLQNPTLTSMALTARAVDHAISNGSHRLQDNNRRRARKLATGGG